MTKNNIVVATWWTGVAIATVALLAPIYRADKVALSLKSPFDNMQSRHAEQWTFLKDAARHVPDGTSFTVVAQDRETEMSLFMMAVGLLPHAASLPSSYYGQSTPIGETARFVLEFEGSTPIRTPDEHALKVTGGWVRQQTAFER